MIASVLFAMSTALLPVPGSLLDRPPGSVSITSTTTGAYGLPSPMASTLVTLL